MAEPYPGQDNDAFMAIVRGLGDPDKLGREAEDIADLARSLDARDARAIAATVYWQFVEDGTISTETVQALDAGSQYDPSSIDSTVDDFTTPTPAHYAQLLMERIVMSGGHPHIGIPDALSIGDKIRLEHELQIDWPPNVPISELHRWIDTVYPRTDLRLSNLTEEEIVALQAEHAPEVLVTEGFREIERIVDLDTMTSLAWDLMGHEHDPTNPVSPDTARVIAQIAIWQTAIGFIPEPAQTSARETYRSFSDSIGLLRLGLMRRYPDKTSEIEKVLAKLTDIARLRMWSTLAQDESPDPSDPAGP